MGQQEGGESGSDMEITPAMACTHTHTHIERQSHGKGEHNTEEAQKQDFEDTGNFLLPLKLKSVVNPLQHRSL